MIESFQFENFVVSIKAADVITTIDACRLFTTKCDYPQHIGITESGTVRTGAIRSSVGLGVLLAEGIGDTIRVSLSGDPVEEVYVAKEILKSLGLASGPDVIA
jgi:(E)-4-hydroxy-3-methylbut-2-enyl-diphosphate synthase